MASGFSGDGTGSERIAPRYGFETTIRILVQRGSENLMLTGWVRDLSESGLGAFVAQGLELGEPITIEIQLGDSGETIPAKVVRTRGTEYGFQFTALSAEQRRLIRATLKGKTAIPLPGSRK